MADEEHKSSSLRGRGRDIMRGSGAEGSQESPGGSSWLPGAPQQPEDPAYFEDDDALLQWMEADPELSRPTVIPNRPLAQLPDTGQLASPEPDFDAIFGDEDEDAPPAMPIYADEGLSPSKPPTQTLDDLFNDGDAPSFDDIFGDLLPEQSAPALPDTDQLAPPPPIESAPATWVNPDDDLDFPDFAEDKFDTREGIESLLPDEPTARIPLRRLEQELLASQMQQEFPEASPPAELPIMEQSFEPPADNPFEAPSAYDAQEIPLPEAAYPTLAEFEEPDLALADLDLESLEDDEDLPAAFDVQHEEPEVRAGGDYYEEPAEMFEDDYPPDLPQEGDWLPDEFSELDAGPAAIEAAYPGEDEAAPYVEEAAEDEAAPYSDAAAILNENFFRAEKLNTGTLPTLALLEEMTQDIPPTEDDFIPEPEDDWLGAPATNEAESFVNMLERETQALPAEMDSEQTSPSAKTATVELVAAAAAAQPLDLSPTLDARDKQQTLSAPFALSQDPPPPLDEGPSEALPMEGDTRPIDLRSARVTPQEDVIPAEAEYFEGYEDSEPPSLEAEIGGAGVISVEDPAPAETTRGLEALQESVLPNPFGPRPERARAEMLFQPGGIAADPELLALFVDDNRLRDLFDQLETLQEEVATNVRGDRSKSDVYLEELLLASNLLLSSRDNYDEARSIVYRIRADLNRERRVEADIRRYGNGMLYIYAATLIAIGTLFLLGRFFVDLSDSVGAPFIGDAYYAMILGALGAWLAGGLTLWRQIAVDRNFDPNQMGGSFINLLFGLISGFIAYLLMWSLNTANTGEVGEAPLTLLVALAAGFRQESIYNWLLGVVDRFTPGDQAKTTPPPPKREDY
jgi:hypothetical protein